MMDEDGGAPEVHADPLSADPGPSNDSGAAGGGGGGGGGGGSGMFDRPFAESASFSGEDPADVARAAERRRAEEERFMREQEQQGGETVFRFKVCEPRMEVPSSPVELAFWIYQVVTKTSKEGWKSDLKVQHRFSDFVWLRDEIVQDHPGVIVPPLPEQDMKGHIEKVVLTNVVLLNYRQRALTKFLMAVGAHPILQNSPLLKGFCECERVDFDGFKAARKKERAETGPSKMTQVSQKSKEGWFRVKEMFGGKKSGEDAPVDAGGRGDPKLRDRKAHAVIMESSIGAARDKLRGMVDARKTMQTAMSELCDVLRGTGDLEKRSNEMLGGDFDATGEYAGKIAKLHRDQADKEGLMVLEMLSFYVGTYNAIRKVAERLQRYEFTMLTGKDELDSATAAEAKAKDKAKAARFKEDKEAVYTKSKEKYEKAARLFDSEWERFHKQKRHEFRHVQRVLVKLQESYFKQTSDTPCPHIAEPVFD